MARKYNLSVCYNCYMRLFRNLAKRTFELRGMGAIVIIGATSAFIASLGIAYNLMSDPHQPGLWVLMAYTFSSFLFFLGLIVGDMINIYESGKRLNKHSLSYYN